MAAKPDASTAAAPCSECGATPGVRNVDACRKKLNLTLFLRVRTRQPWHHLRGCRCCCVLVAASGHRGGQDSVPTPSSSEPMHGVLGSSPCWRRRWQISRANGGAGRGGRTAAPGAVPTAAVSTVCRRRGGAAGLGCVGSGRSTRIGLAQRSSSGRARGAPVTGGMSKGRCGGDGQESKMGCRGAKRARGVRHAEGGQSGRRGRKVDCCTGPIDSPPPAGCRSLWGSIAAGRLARPRQRSGVVEGCSVQSVCSAGEQ